MRKTITGNKTVTKTPPKKASKAGLEDVWRSPRNHNKSRDLEDTDRGCVCAREVADLSIGDERGNIICRHQLLSLH